PEYPLYEYALKICYEEYDGTTESAVAYQMTSEEFDHIIRTQIDSYEEATNGGGGNNWDINFLTSDQLDTKDPYFNTAYSVHTYNYSVTSDLTTRKEFLMNYALNTNYNNTGYSMLEFAYITVMDGNTYTTLSGIPNTWAGVQSNCTVDELNQVWNTYKSL